MTEPTIVLLADAMIAARRDALARRLAEGFVLPISAPANPSKAS